MGRIHKFFRRGCHLELRRESPKNGAIISNSGHLNVELDLDGLGRLADHIKQDVRKEVDAYVMKDGRRLFVLGQGRLVNLACAEGHPASVMDMSFATQTLATEYVIKSKGKLGAQVYDVPASIDDWVAELKLHQPDFGIKPYSAALGALKVKPDILVRVSVPRQS